MHGESTSDKAEKREREINLSTMQMQNPLYQATLIHRITGRPWAVIFSRWEELEDQKRRKTEQAETVQARRENEARPNKPSSPDRIMAYDHHKRRIGLPDIKPFATIPTCWTVKSLLNTKGWFVHIKDPDPDEVPEKDIHFKVLQTNGGDEPWKPRAVIMKLDEEGTKRIRGYRDDLLSDYKAVSLTITDIPFGDGGELEEFAGLL